MNHHRSCQVCHKACRPLRCTSCRQAWYCSQQCQKKDWNAGHRHMCRKSKGAAVQPRSMDDDDDDDERRANHALMELSSLAANTNKLSLEELSAEFYKAKDEVERLQQSTTTRTRTSTKSGGAKETYSKEGRRNNTTIEKTLPDYKSNSDRTELLPRKSASVASSPQEIESIGNCDSSQETASYWDFWIENLTHISCYHIVLRPTNHNNNNNEKSQYWLLKQPISELARQLEFRVTVSTDRQSSVVSLRHKSDANNNNNTKINNNTLLFNARLPGHVQSMPSAFQIQQDETQSSGHGLNLRLQYEAPIHTLLEQDAAGLTETDANRLGCRQCHLPLLAGGGKKGATVIDRVVRMPSANWDDIADYLICYSGQATIDFTTSSTNNAQLGVALVDTSAIILHQDDVGSAVCVLAVEGYGEHNNTTTVDAANTMEPLSGESLSSSSPAPPPPTSPFAAAAADLGNDAPAVIRGPRSWRVTVEGGSICCSQCCSVLGFASLTSPGTYRFLKHRLALLNTPTINNESGQQPNNHPETRNATPLIRADSFIAHEMIRYAETKAIFTFMVERNDDSGRSSQRRVLLLKLLSWDSQVATSSEVSYVSSDAHLVQEVNLRKAAKIIFEETWLASSKKGAEDHRNNDDISSWVWGGADLCCQPNFVGSVGDTPASNEEQGNDKIAPGVVGQASTSSVWLLLEKDEWDELLKSLCTGAQLFSKEVVEATVAAKLGRRVIPNNPTNGLGLSLIPIAL